MILLKDTTMFGKAIIPLLEKTTQHHLVVNNVEKICRTVFDQYKGINGFRLDFKGRIGGSARSRARSLKLGSLSNQQIDSNIDYTLHEAVTRYGVCSLRIWLC
jgi:ribosomal protein S3